MNFFQRRKVLKNINYLDLTPVRLMQDQLSDNDRIDILLPRFKRRFWRELSRNSKKGEYIRIHLDEIGSAIWLLIDGQKKVITICDELNQMKVEKLKPIEETEKRVTQFLSMLYQERYISFREILPK
jgi:hypothetical protein